MFLYGSIFNYLILIAWFKLHKLGNVFKIIEEFLETK